MGVYIKGMDKPKCCGACLLCLDDSRIANGYCMIFHRRVNMAELDSDCPLVSVKAPHGALIDADAFIDSIQDQSVPPFLDKGDIEFLCKEESTLVEAEVE